MSKEAKEKFKRVKVKDQRCKMESLITLGVSCKADQRSGCCCASTFASSSSIAIESEMKSVAVE